MNYQISLTQEQLKVVEQACELLCRLYLGQLRQVAELFTMRIPAATDDEAIAKYRQLQECLTELQPIVTGMDSPHASYGIGNPEAHPNSAIAYEIWRSIECHRNPASHAPLKLTSHPLPDIHAIEEQSHTVEWLDPTPEMLETSEFEAVWQCIKTWDINVPEEYSGYMGATGNHVRAILDALSQAGETANDRESRGKRDRT